ncbi:MAG TPA: Ig-like domain repeat protein [Phycisphaerae bacterium]|nr:Ig-like domain repeat protein [Phycisphaerae bacterium]
MRTRPLRRFSPRPPMLENLEARTLFSLVPTSVLIQPLAQGALFPSLTVYIFDGVADFPIAGGQLTISEGANTLITKSVAAATTHYSNGSVSLTFSLPLAPGSHTLVASYSPDGPHRPSTSAATTVDLPHYTLIAEGAATGSASSAYVVNRANDLPLLHVTPFGAGFRGGVNVALGDVDGDGVPDLIVAPQTGLPLVEVYNLSGQVISAFYAFNPAFHGGVNLAAGDTNHDGVDDIVVGAGAGGGPEVKIFSGTTYAVLADYDAFAPAFRGGVSVAAGDVDGDGAADVTVTTGDGVRPQATVFSDDTTTVRWNSFLAAAGTVNASHIALRDLNNDGHADILAVSDSINAGIILYFGPNSPNAGIGSGSVLYHLPTPGGWNIAFCDPLHAGTSELILSGPGTAPLIYDPRAGLAWSANPRVYGGAVNDSVATFISP